MARIVPDRIYPETCRVSSIKSVSRTLAAERPVQIRPDDACERECLPHGIALSVLARPIRFDPSRQSKKLSLRNVLGLTYCTFQDHDSSFTEENHVPKDNETAKTFGTAYDLPQVQELVREIRSFDAIKRALRDEQRAELSRAQSTLSRLVETVDSFYDLLGHRNWVFHGDMNLKFIEKVIGAENSEEAEARLISYYQDRKATEFLFTRLFRIEGFRPRLPTISRAYEDYLAGRYYACILALVPVLDGTVNDTEKTKRRGLHAREPEEMIAWDSVTAHHLGLKHTQKAFTKTFRKTEESEVFELYRHGIVHGMVINFDNVIVATKALNQVFAIADWAESLLVPSQEKDPVPTPSDLREMARNLASAEQINDSFQTSEIVAGDTNFDGHDLATISHDYLEAWQNQNYGHLSGFLPKFPGESRGQRAGQAKNLYREFQLSNYAVTKIKSAGPILTTVEVQAEINGSEQTFVLRWVQMDEGAQPVLPGQPGEWTLAPHGPTTFLKL
jgi:ASC-1-like (ASCH) protein